MAQHVLHCSTSGNYNSFSQHQSQGRSGRGGRGQRQGGGGGEATDQILDAAEWQKLIEDMDERSFGAAAVSLLFLSLFYHYIIFVLLLY